MPNMGISFANIKLLEDYDLIGMQKRILDFGSSNLYGATPEQIINFVEKHNPRPRRNLNDWATTFANGSGVDANGVNKNESFAGELFEMAGMNYDSIDIAKGYKTTIVDLNTQVLPEEMVGKYDSVLNFGTSEHILNQMNTFAAVHAATKSGGLMMHSVPSIGFVDHGYFCYTSRFFFDMAGYNEYELVDMWFEQTEGSENLFASARQYQTYFPTLRERLARIDTEERERSLNLLQVPVISLSIIYRKTTEKPFMGMVETSTSVGDVSALVLGSYASTT
jgi:hypothetical protein